MNFVYPVTLTPDPDGGFVVTFPDWPEAITQGETRDQALEEAADCLEEAVAARIDDRAEIPLPSSPQSGETTVAVPIATAIKGSAVPRSARGRHRHQRTGTAPGSR